MFTIRFWLMSQMVNWRPCTMSMFLNHWRSSIERAFLQYVYQRLTSETMSSSWPASRLVASS
jgi:hypothetical protein